METHPLVRLHVPNPLEDAPLALPFWSRFPGAKGSIMYDKHLPPNFFETSVSYVEAAEAQAIVLPNTFAMADEKVRAYVAAYADMGEKLGIPVFVFSFGDLNDLVPFDPRVYVFRQSVYRSTMRAQDIVVPTITEDNAKEGIVLHQKQSVPIVSFCGQGDYQTITQQVKYHIKVWRWKMASIFNPILRARIIGVYWRKKMMRACERSNMVKTFFIVRKSFSGAHRTIELDPAQARREYLDSIINSDFVLAPKGDGNYSNRFLKTLCMGRIPVVPDTDIVLPLEGHIDYEKIMVRVPMNNIQDTPKLVREWYDARSEVEWQAAQHKAREVFATKLRFDSFFDYFFTKVLAALPRNPRASAAPTQTPQK